MVELARHGSVTGVELSETSACLASAREAGEVIRARCSRCRSLDASFDLAVSLDVIEHLEDDVGALRELRRVVAPGGSLLVTVPAYPWLWSGHDEVNHHHRRYTQASLLAGAARRRLGVRAHDLLQLAAAAGRDHAAPARAPEQEDDRVEPRPVGAHRAAELAARAPARARGRADRPRPAHPGRACRCWPSSATQLTPRRAASAGASCETSTRG